MAYYKVVFSYLYYCIVMFCDLFNRLLSFHVNRTVSPCHVHCFQRNRFLRAVNHTYSEAFMIINFVNLSTALTVYASHNACQIVLCSE